MGRYNTILDGNSINDIDEGGSYDYYGYSRSEGSWVIMRMDSAGTNARYAVGGFAYSTAWTGRVGLSYARAEAYKY